MKFRLDTSPSYGTITRYSINLKHVNKYKYDTKTCVKNLQQIRFKVIQQGSVNDKITSQILKQRLFN